MDLAFHVHYDDATMKFFVRPQENDTDCFKQLQRRPRPGELV